jgi:hypothetical protein
VIYVECPGEYRPAGLPAVFLAGGITGCPDWQAAAAAGLAGLAAAVLNPRRRDFPMGDPAAAPAQIDWEYRHLRHADAALFWFPAESVCPIALYELGAWAAGDKPLFVGTAPAYPRRLDVVEQLRLARPGVWVAADLPAVLAAVSDWALKTLS